MKQKGKSNGFPFLLAVKDPTDCMFSVYKLKTTSHKLIPQPRTKKVYLRAVN